MITDPAHTRSPRLLSSHMLHEIHLRNRVVMAPLTRGRAGAERVPNDLMAEYYSQRAGAGLIVAEATVVSEQGNGWVGSPGIYNDVQQAGWEKITRAVHTKGAPIFLQLWHCGRASHRSFHNGQPPVAPSAIKIEGDSIQTPEGELPYEIPRPLEVEEFPGIIEDYRRAAERAVAAGFDGVEIHAANGYLLDQFLQSKTNHRNDAFGGSPENRFRLLKRILKAVQTVVPPFKIGVRLSPNGNLNDMGSPDYRETFTYVVAQLETFGLAYLHVVDGTGYGFHELGEPMTLADVRAVFTGPIIGNCGYTQQTAEAAITSGNADLIAFGRPFISNPDLVDRFFNNQRLAPAADPAVWSAPDHRGYTDFPTFNGRGGGSFLGR